MKNPPVVPTDLMVTTDRPGFLAEIRRVAGDPDGVRVGSVNAGPRPGSVGACLAALNAGPCSILLVDAEPEPATALLLVRELFDRQPAARILVAGKAGDPDLILRAMRAGATEFFPLPLERRTVLEGLQRIWRRAAPEKTPGPRRRGRIYPFVGSKRGCGTTTVATNLAVTLAGRGKSTLLVDLDLPSTDAALLLNLNPSFTVVDVVQNAHRLDRDLLNGMVVKHVSGLEVLAACEDPDRTAIVEPGRMGPILNFFREQFDCVVVNTGDPAHPLTQATLAHADLIHLVTCLDLLSLRRAQWVLRSFARYGLAKDILRLVINRQEKNPYLSPDDAEKALDLGVAWSIPADAKTALDALNEGIPFVNKSRNGLLSSFDGYATELLGAAPAGQSAARGRRLFGLFSGRASREIRTKETIA